MEQIHNSIHAIFNSQLTDRSTNLLIMGNTFNLSWMTTYITSEWEIVSLKFVRSWALYFFPFSEGILLYPGNFCFQLILNYIDIYIGTFKVLYDSENFAER